ncbi:multiubiquitin domain-containing protein [Salinarimonas rosea]|uniref:multiubiquitin domain-containing protein n=1 Tax=Salinarimonas rosea TaxID=552063 RepID=UPI00040F6BDE|nr:multiubiquitin domain-containing protein [Salinarimonas rosea]
MDSTPAPAGDTAAIVPIRVNRRPFSVAPGVTGAQIAALLGVPADNAVVEAQGADGTLVACALDAPAPLAPHVEFLVTRQYVMGGAPAADGR